MRLWTVERDGPAAQALAEELGAAGVQRVVDVRFGPPPRRRGQGWSRPPRRPRLAAQLAEQGIVWKSGRALGLPQHIRLLVEAGRGAEARATFAVWIAGSYAMDALVRDLPDAPPTALLFLAADGARPVITAELEARLPDLEVVNL